MNEQGFVVLVIKIAHSITDSHPTTYMHTYIHTYYMRLTMAKWGKMIGVAKTSRGLLLWFNKKHVVNSKAIVSNMKLFRVCIQLSLFPPLTFELWEQLSVI